MDNLERRLKEDAAAIEAEVSPELALRIQASLHAAERARPDERADKAGFSMWWISSLTGVAAALLVITILSRNADVTPEAPLVEPSANIVPATLPGSDVFMPLNAETAELTGPLEEELERLKSDIEKARESVERDLRESF